MGWDVFAGLIITHGLPLALKLWAKWGNKDVVTPEEIEELRALGAQTPQSQMRDALARAGISANDPRAAQLLALVGVPPLPPVP